MLSVFPTTGTGYQARHGLTFTDDAGSWRVTDPSGDDQVIATDTNNGACTRICSLEHVLHAAHAFPVHAAERGQADLTGGAHLLSGGATTSGSSGERAPQGAPPPAAAAAKRRRRRGQRGTGGKRNRSSRGCRQQRQLRRYSRLHRQQQRRPPAPSSSSGQARTPPCHSHRRASRATGAAASRHIDVPSLPTLDPARQPLESSQPPRLRGCGRRSEPSELAAAAPSRLRQAQRTDRAPDPCMGELVRE